MKKKIACILFLIITIVLLLPCAGCSAAGNDDYLRLHIRANSNNEHDQNVKLKVRDEVISYLTPKLSGAKDAYEAKKIVSGELDNLVAISEKTLKKYGFSYGAQAEIRFEKFPERTYGELTLKEGYYDSIIIELGSGKGDNWWCVAFPPLCFVGEGEGEPEYRSLIVDLIEKWRQNEKK